jgi:transposase-like protein
VKKNVTYLLNNLTTEEKVVLFNKLKAELTNLISTTVSVCPCCNGTSFVKDGKYKGVQKYQCKASKKYFTYKTNTILSGINKLDKLSELINLLSNGVLPTIDQIQHTIHICHQTAFDWRTKILTCLYNEIDMDNQVIEFDEAFHYLSRKGRKGMKYARKRGSKKRVGDNSYTGKVFMTFSRATKQIDFHFSHIGRTKATNVGNYLGTCKDIVVYSDSHRSYSSYFKKAEVEHDKFIAKDHVSQTNKEVHNQTVNAYARSFKNLINDQCHGVSTKYIQGYCNWLSFVSNAIKEGVKPAEVVTENKVALQIYKQKEREFGYVLKLSGRTDYGVCKQRYKMAA